MFYDLIMILIFYFSHKALALIRYITNYARKKNCNRYQRIIKTAFARKISENAIVIRNSIEFEIVIKFIYNDKFALRTVNRLTHNKKINDFFVVNSLFDLSDFSPFFKKMKKQIFSFFPKKLLIFLFSINDSNALKNFVRFSKFKRNSLRYVPSLSMKKFSIVYVLFVRIF